MSARRNPRFPYLGLFLGGAMLLAAGSGFAANATATDPEMTAAAQQIQKACVARGENAQVCACGVGLGYAQLEPKTFKLIPEVEPLLSEQDKFKAISSLVAAANKRGLSASDLMSAYETIKANRETSRGICKPLASITAPKAAAKPKSKAD